MVAECTHVVGMALLPYCKDFSIPELPSSNVHVIYCTVYHIIIHECVSPYFSWDLLFVQIFGNN